MRKYECHVKWNGISGKYKNSFLADSDESAIRIARAIAAQLEAPKKELITVTVKAGIRILARVTSNDIAQSTHLIDLVVKSGNDAHARWSESADRRRRERRCGQLALIAEEQFCRGLVFSRLDAQRRGHKWSVPLSHLKRVMRFDRDHAGWMQRTHDDWKLLRLQGGGNP